MPTLRAHHGSAPARPLAAVLAPGPRHLVGDGFDVRTVFWPDRDALAFSPFLLLDFGARRTFGPSSRRRGVGPHPHRGFETVTFVYEGAVEHRDSAGGGGTIGPGDVQWMTAGAGVVHEEFHARAYAERGGPFEVIQLWVNLPARVKRTPPRYQPIRDGAIPRARLGAAQARVVAGTVAGRTGPARAHTPMWVFDGRFDRAGEAAFEAPPGWNVLVLCIEGALRAGPDRVPVPVAHLARFSPEAGGPVVLSGAPGTRFLALAGEPIREPVAAYGPFVMNTREELLEAVEDFRAGRMGRLPGREG